MVKELPPEKTHRELATERLESVDDAYAKCWAGVAKSRRNDWLISDLVQIWGVDFLNAAIKRAEVHVAIREKDDLALMYKLRQGGKL